MGYIYALLFSISIYICVLNLSIVKFEKKNMILWIGVVSLIAGTIGLINNGLIILVVNLSVVLMMYLQQKIVLTGIITSIFSTIIFVVSDYVRELIAIEVFNVDILESIGFLEYLSMWILVYLISYLISLVLGFFIRRKISSMEMYLKFKTCILIVIILILTIVIYYINIILNEGYTPSSNLVKVNGALFITYFILLLVVVFSVLSTVKKEIKLKDDINQLENLREYTKNLEDLYLTFRKFKHDHTNIITSMAGYIEANDMSGLKEFFEKNISPLTCELNMDKYSILRLQNIKAIELKGILSSKIIVAQNQNIKVSIDIIGSIDKINIEALDICRIIGIILDNSIEAAVECRNPEIKIALVNNINNNSVQMIFVNNYCRKVAVPNISKIFERNYSTKGKNRGLGLSNLKEIINKYDNVILDTSIKENKFIQILEIY
ncbi:sensor histidine kinase [Clostridium ihumii]|uniref:sensor histidine kinase n=1 Tax=Clostridium ihumii TaxID=1470356 RepID=UPI003D34F7EC